MKSISGKEIAEFVGISAIIASLIFVGLQLRQDKDLATAEIWSNNDQRVADLSGLVTANRDLWVNGLKGEELSEADQAAFRSICVAVIQRWENEVHRARLLNFETRHQIIARTLAYQLYQYPGLRRTYAEISAERRMKVAAFGGSGKFDFRVDVENALAELDRSLPPMPEPTYTPY